MTENYLGEGFEGVVYRMGDNVIKIFHANTLPDEEAKRIAALLPTLGPAFPRHASLEKINDRWQLTYPWFDSEPVSSIHPTETKNFLVSCVINGIVPDNFKMANLRRTNDRLVYIDIGKHLRKLDLDSFRDTAAKAFALLNIMSETQLVSGFSQFRAQGKVETMIGFPGFYAEIMQRAAEAYWIECTSVTPTTPKVSANVTLLIKCCAMDHMYLERQVTHLVRQLESPRRFAEIVLAIDPQEGKYLRQHNAGDINNLRNTATRLLKHGIINRIIESHKNIESIRTVNRRWFNEDCAESHSSQGIPIFPQLHAFEQIRTRYMLQADCDVLVGRMNPEHDFISEMMQAHMPHDILGVGFCIPQPEESRLKTYDAPEGEYKPEVRLGFFDVIRLQSSLPWRNPQEHGKLSMGWYQSLHCELARKGCRCVRGGDSSTFYIHPRNTAKIIPGLIEHARAEIEMGRFPEAQAKQWDLVEDLSKWNPRSRTEDIIFLIMGRNTPLAKVDRCLRSLIGQRDQNFGIILLDDGSEPHHAATVASYARKFGEKMTWISKTHRHGRVPNKWECIHKLIPRPESMIVVLDMDDALVSNEVVEQIRRVWSEGAEIAVGGMYRPDKPTKIYHVDFSSAADHRGAGNVWNHLRCFRRSAYETMTQNDLMRDGRWFDSVSDYLTMIPMTKRTSRHRILHGFLCWHERSTPPSATKRIQDKEVIDWVLSRNKSRSPVE